jgi:hypothetical protein
MVKLLHKHFLILCLTALTVGSAHAQYFSRNAISSSGDTYSTPSVTVSYVAGEAIGGLLYNTTINPHLYLTTGFEQPDVEVSQVLTNSAISLAVFPNPTNSSTVKLVFNHVPDGVYTINVFDALGKILQSQIVNYKAINYYYVPIDISQYAGGDLFYTSS